MERTVVFRRSPGKMTFEKHMTTLLLSLSLINAITGSSYSNVYVESQTNPLRRLPYAAPYTSIASPQIAEVNNLPANIPTYVACVTPCPIPEQTVAAINPNPSVLRYNSQPYATVPVVVSPMTKEDTTGYEYSYTVYDDNTGDHKAQRELSDGSVVQGEYSFLQPNGLVREVQYVADDVKGFNAIVKHFLPIALNDKKRYDVKETTEPATPSNEVKKEDIKASEDVSEIKIVQNNQDLEKTPVVAYSLKYSAEPVNKKNTAIEQEKDAEDIQNPERIQVPELNNERQLEITRKYVSKEPKESSEMPKNNSDVYTNEESSSELQKTPTKNPEKQSEEKTTSTNPKPFIDITPKGQQQITNVMTPLKERDVLVPYSDIVRCVQAALKRANSQSLAVSEEPSPLTYIILNRPC